MKTRKKIAVLVVSQLLVTSSFLSTAWSSSHREAPAITEKPKVDSTDFYVFKSYEPGRDNYVTLIANYIPLQDPQGGPNYFSMDQDALYEIHIDNNADAVEDISYQFRFTNDLANNGIGLTVPVGVGNEKMDIEVPLKHIGPIAAGDLGSLGFNESFTIDIVTGGRRNNNATAITNVASGGDTFTKPYDYVGNKTFTNAIDYDTYANQYIYDINIPGCAQTGKVFVGQRKESFVVNLGETFDLVNYVPIEDGAFPGGIVQDPANDDLAAKNITTIAMEVHQDCLTGNGGGTIGAWTTASLRQAQILNPKAEFNRDSIHGGAWTQVSRLSNPLVNELVIGLKDKDTFNASHPVDDGQFGKFVTHPSLPFLLDVLFNKAVNTVIPVNNLAPVNIPRDDLVAVFLTGINGLNQVQGGEAAEMMRLNTAIPATPMNLQDSMGVLADDLAGYPNGRRPGDDVVDIALRVVMGRLCHPVTLNGATVDLQLCAANQAEVGLVPFTDGAPINALNFDNAFPYLVTPNAGSPN